MSTKATSVHISERRVSAKSVETTGSNENDSLIHRHSSEQFTRFHDITDDCWRNKYYYMLFCVLVTTGGTVFPPALSLMLHLSGGGFVVLLIISTIVMCLPLLYMKVFLGMYTRLTDCQIYRMAPIYFGICIVLFFAALIYITMQVVQHTELMVSMLRLLTNPDINIKCLEENEECYDYKINGPLNDTCEYHYISMMCENMGEIRYPLEYQYWRIYRDPNSTIYPYHQIIVGVFITWALILGIIMKGICTLGLIVTVAFILQFLALSAIFMLATFHKGSWRGLRILLSVKLINFNIFEILMVLAYSLSRIGLITPLGHTTYAAYTKFDSDMRTECFIICMLSIVLLIYYIAGFCLVCGVIAKAMGVTASAVVIPDTGLFIALIPEFLVYLEIPNLYILLYFLILWFFEVVKLALSAHFLVLNLFDFFPSTKNFSVYVWVTSCIVLLIATIPACNQYYNTIMLPLSMSLYMKYMVLAIVGVEVTTVSYVYGVSRLCNDIRFMWGKKIMKFFPVMWYSTPILALCSLVIITFRYRHENFRKDGLVERVTEHEWNTSAIMNWSFLFTYILYTVMYIIFRFGTPNLLLLLFKPQFFWGPPQTEARIERKNFCPDTAIRSQNIEDKDNQTEHIKNINHQLVSQLTHNLLKEQIKKGGVIRDKTFLPSIGIYSEEEDQQNRTEEHEETID